MATKTVMIDMQYIDQLRRDFLTLMKNVPRISTWKDAEQVRVAFTVFRKQFDKVFFESFLNHDLKYDEILPEGDRKWYDRKLRSPAWSFSIELSLPIDQPNEYYSEEARLSRFFSDRDRWAARVKDKARALWKEIREFVEYLERTKKPEGYPVKVPAVEQMDIDGFRVRVIGLDSELTEEFEQFKEALRIFKSRAARVLPIMVRTMLPIHLLGYAKDSDAAGRYKGNHIEIYLSGFILNKSPAALTKTIAHEMGHHLHRVVLSDADRTFWDTAIRQDFSHPLDLVKLLEEQWTEDSEWAFNFIERIKDRDPVLSLQVDVASRGYPAGSSTPFQKRDELKRIIEKGERTIVPKTPITGYAGKNPEEAFCEAVGMLVAYGPAAVHPMIRHWLSMILPGLKAASNTAERVAQRYEAIR